MPEVKIHWKVNFMNRVFGFLYSVIFLIAFTSSAMAHPTSLNCQEAQKIYVQPSDLLVNENGLFLRGKFDLIPLSSIATDEYGFYVELMERPAIGPYDGIPKCFNGHPIWHVECNGCANWWCPQRCKCYSPWSVEL